MRPISIITSCTVFSPAKCLFHQKPWRLPWACASSYLTCPAPLAIFASRIWTPRLTPFQSKSAVPRIRATGFTCHHALPSRYERAKQTRAQTVVGRPGGGVGPCLGPCIPLQFLLVATHRIPYRDRDRSIRHTRSPHYEC